MDFSRFSPGSNNFTDFSGIAREIIHQLTQPIRSPLPTPSNRVPLTNSVTMPNPGAPSILVASTAPSDQAAEPIASGAPGGIRNDEKTVLSIITDDHLTCPVCLDQCKSKPIYQCTNGHTVCNNCIPHLRCCPLCRSYLPPTRIRNRVIETLLDYMEVACPYKARGCPATLKNINMKEHIFKCNFGKVIVCPSLGIPGCTEAISGETMTEHFKTAHKLTCMEKKCSTAIITYENFLSTATLNSGDVIKWEPIVITPFPDAGPFIVHAELDVEHNCMATFAVVYGHPQAPQGDALEESPHEDSQTRFWVEFSIHEKHFAAFRGNYFKGPPSICFRGESMLYDDYKAGAKQGIFTVQLADYRTMPAFVPARINAGVAVNGTPAQNQPAAAAASLPTNQADGQNPPVIVEEPAEIVTRVKMAKIKLNLVVEIRFGKTKDALDKPCDKPDVGSCCLKRFSSNEKVMFRSATCAVCKIGPVVGSRFRCLECPMYDVCSNCMLTKRPHGHHSFIYIRSVEQNTRVSRNWRRIYRQGPSPAQSILDAIAEAAAGPSDDAPNPKRLKEESSNVVGNAA